ncbi:MAG: N-acetylglucosamine malate deacetylase 2 [Acidobacteriota bacterium]|nr:N-acetylglucosamine malate deacetylase 2 [Acidobacteriota bacterium]
MPREPGLFPGFPRFLLLAAHPDDETIGAGALLGRSQPQAVIHVTDGAPRDLAWAPAANGDREGYARERRRELEAAMALAGVPAERLVSLGIVDQEAVLDLPGLAERLAGIFSDLASERVLTVAYEGGHPDHDAVAFAAHAAAELLRRRGRGAPELWEMALYHAGAEAGEGGIVTGRFLALTPQPPLPAPHPSPGRGGDSEQHPPSHRHPERSEVELPLSPAEAELKRRMIAAFVTQEETLRPFLPPRPERFRPAPAYRFTEPPHPGPLQYEVWAFPMDGARWRRHARQALRALDLPEGSDL